MEEEQGQWVPRVEGAAYAELMWWGGVEGGS